MLSSAHILIAFEVLCHAALALLHLWHRLGLPSLSHEARETLAGLLYAGLAGGSLVGAIAYAY